MQGYNDAMGDPKVNQITQGCQAVNQNVEYMYAHSLNLNQDLETSNNFSKQIIVIPEENKLFLFSNINQSRQIVVKQMKLQYSSQENDKTQKIDQIIDENLEYTFIQVNTNTHPQEPQYMIKDKVLTKIYQGIPFIFTYYGVYTFDPKQQLTKSNQSSYFTLIENQKLFNFEIKKVTQMGEYFTVFYGNQGADIFKFNPQNKSLEFFKLIELDPKINKIVDMYCDGINIYLLHQNVGFEIMNIEQQQHKLVSILVKNAQSFAIHNNTLLILTNEEPNQILFEYYINIENNYHYLNKKETLYTSQVHTIQMFENIAFLISDTMVKQVYHSLFYMFIDNEEVYTDEVSWDSFSVTLIQNINSSYDPSSEKQSQYYNMIALRFEEDEFYIDSHNFQLQQSYVKCVSDVQIEKQYILVQNKTCLEPLNQDQNIKSYKDPYFQQCQYNQLINLSTINKQNIYVDKDLSSTIISTLLIILAFGITLFFIYFILKYRRDKKQKEIIEMQNLFKNNQTHKKQTNEFDIESSEKCEE